jgi:hypothetical protein
MGSAERLGSIRDCWRAKQTYRIDLVAALGASLTDALREGAERHRKDTRETAYNDDARTPEHRHHVPDVGYPRPYSSRSCCTATTTTG